MHLYQGKWLICLLLALYGFSTPLAAQEGTLSGKVINDQGSPLPYANIVIVDKDLGTSTNIDGEYRLSLPYGTYTIRYQFIGYQQEMRRITIGSSAIRMDITLSEQAVSLEEVEIRSDTENPAYEVIRQAQAMRITYKNEFPQSTIQAYTRLFGKGNRLSYGELAVFGTKMTVSEGVFYLSETFSRIQTEEKRSLEDITASLVAGDSAALSANKAVFLNFYMNRSLASNNVQMVSPIASDAMSFYDYKYKGFFEEDGEIVNKIQLIPKSQGLPAFRGHIYILEDSWRIHSLDLKAFGAAAGNIGWQIYLKIAYSPLSKSDAWVPLSVDLLLDNNKDEIRYYSRFSSFSPKANLSNEHPGLRLRISENANTKPTAFWEENRPIPLTADERKAYEDKLPQNKYRLFEDSPDSLNTNNAADTVSNATDSSESETEEKSGSLGKLLFSGGKAAISPRLTLQYPPPFSLLDYNLVEGFVFKLQPRLLYKSKAGKIHQLESDLRYGFAGRRPYAQVKGHFQLNTKRQESLSLSGGHYIHQYAGEQVVTPSLNAFYTLFDNYNFMKLYEQTYIKAVYQTTLFKNLDFSVGGGIAQRRPLENSTDFRIIGNKDRAFTPNQPFINGQAMGFEEHRAYLLDASLTIYLDRPYEIRGKKKKYLPGRLPILSVSYRQGMGEVNFQQWHATIKGSTQLGILGISKIQLSYGDFIGQDQITPIDFFHFAGNRTFSMQQQTTFGLRYQLLNYYGYSTNHAFFGGNYEHTFKGAILGKLPFFRRVGWHLVTTANYLRTQQIDNYLEIGVGIENILGPMRLAYYRSVGDRANSLAGFRLAIPLVSPR